MKEKFYAFAFCVLLFSTTGYSQVTFESFYDSGSSDFGSSVVALSNGYIFCGTILDDANGDFDVIVTKVDEEGEIIWSDIYTSIGVGDDYASYITPASDGGFAVCGTTFDPDFGDEDAFILRIDSNGNEIWQEQYDGGEADMDGANYIIESSAEEWIVAGYASDEFGQYMWVFITDDSGALVWENFLDMSADDEALVVLETDDGGMAVAGSSYDWDNEDYDGALVKLDAAGEIEWSYYSIGIGDEHFNDIILDSYGDFLLAGAEEDVIAGDYDLLLENVDFDGTITYYSHVFDYAAGDDEAYRVYWDGSDYFVAGYVEDTDNGDYDAYLALVDAENGDILSDVLYGDFGDDEFFDFDFTDDGGFVCIGYSTVDGSGDTDIYLVKTDENGEVSDPVGLSDPEEVANVLIYPNPAENEIFLTSGGYNQYRIMSMDGRVVDQGTLIGTRIDIAMLPAGTYQLVVAGTSGQVVLPFVRL